VKAFEVLWLTIGADDLPPKQWEDLARIRARIFRRVDRLEGRRK